MEYACPFTRPVVVLASDSAELVIWRKPKPPQKGLKQKNLRFESNDHSTEIEQERLLFTSIEHPIMEPLSRAFLMMENRPAGAFLVS